MSSYTYADGAIHHDNHKEMTVNVSSQADIVALIKAFMADDVEDVVSVEEITTEIKNPSLLSCIEKLMDEKDEKGNYLVNQGNHWIAIFRIVVDKNLGASDTDYLGFCNMVNGWKPEGFRVPLKQNNLKSMSKTMYHKPFDKWKYDPTFNPTRKPYDKMVEIATRFKAILEENGL